MAQRDERYLGIDLGTTNSTAAVFDGEQVTVVRSGRGSPLTPSVVRIDGRGRWTTGARARRFLESDPENTHSAFKRLMGTEHLLRFAASGQEHPPERLAAEVLSSIRHDVEEQLGFAPARAVISVPALFELPQSAATSEAARLAGFAQVELIGEPVASALAAGWSDTEAAGGPWLVYDLGGGTFDASLLETRDGLLRVVAHDGDNFLGGRDFDRAIADLALQRAAAEAGVAIDRAEPAHAAGLRALQHAAEEAKIDLTRADETDLALPGAFEVEGEAVDIDLVLTRAELDGLVGPIVQRSVAVCHRLLQRCGITPDQLGRVVLVGGPTVMPAVREAVRRGLGARFGEGLDPMTLVARGAALYAATAGLDARPPETDAPAPTAGRSIWLQYPAMSADLTPHVAGRLLEGDERAPTEVRLVRHDGQATPWTRLSPEGGLVVMVELEPRRPNSFRLEGRDGDEPVALDPPSISIVQGLTLSDPPLSRTVGIALADDTVHVYLERGTPLPARRTFVHHTVQSLARGGDGAVLSIPIVQGELDRAHLCRLVGRLDIGGAALRETLPAGSPVEVTVEIDRGGRLSARALVPRLEQVFEQVARLVVPDAPVSELSAQVELLEGRLAELRTRAVQADDPRLLDRLFDVEWALQDARQGVEAARGGDADAAQKARRTLIDTDGVLAGLESDLGWPELDARASHAAANAAHWVSLYGTPQEATLLGEASQGLQRARTTRNAVEVQRQLRVVTQLAVAARYRHPEAWQWAFDHAASDIGSCSDLPRAEKLVREGRDASARGDREALRQVVQQLWTLLPYDARERQLGHDSGLR